ncbi:MAG: glycyl-radical enzyme activating protein [Holdemanella sp.]|nr:glycyl-radical enzyme activating protein [Holdemanella sp.]
MKKGIVFNIQKFSIHDGPGIRTTVFLKGCPLRCRWCANPESQLENIQILWDKKKCIHCLHCIDVCTHKAISLKEDRIHIDFDLCKGCLQCNHECNQKALTFEGEYKEIDEIVKECLQDLDFYEESNGGVTISGGEGMAQPDFVLQLIHELHKHKIHVAIETTGFIEKETFRTLASQFDLLLFDVKHYDSHKHFEYTDVHNELIVENLAWANEQGIDILCRIPVIPGFNDSLEDAIHFSELFKSLNIKKVQLLPFHQFGENKYELLNKQYAYKNVKAYHPEDLKDYQKQFLNNDIECFF